MYSRVYVVWLYAVGRFLLYQRKEVCGPCLLCEASGERKAQICMYLVCMYVVCTYVRVYEVGCACTVLPDFCSLGATGIFFADSF